MSAAHSPLSIETIAQNAASSAAKLKSAFNGVQPKTAIVLGSGLDQVHALLNVETTIPYTDLPGFPLPTVQGHSGTLEFGTIGTKPVVFLNGRQHLYEGQGTDGLKTMIHTMKEVGVDNLILTNAVGSINAQFPVGSLVVIKDHINFTGTNPLVGPNNDRVGPRFFSMANAWDEECRQRLSLAFQKAGVQHREGIYLQVLGPNFETPAEINLFRGWNADTVGMSTVVENLIAVHCGLKCTGINAVTNLAEGLSDVVLSHEQTLAGARLAQADMAKVLYEYVIG